MLFDLDGTLVQHLHVLLPKNLDEWGYPRPAEAVNHVFHVQIEWFYEYAQELVTQGRDDPMIWSRFYRRVVEHLEIEDETVYRRMQEFFSTQPTPPLFGDVRPTLARLASGPWRLGIITQRGRGGATQFLADHGLLELFAVIVAGDDGRGRKPAAEPFQHAMSVLDTSPRKTVFIGDRIDDDCAGALSAGLQPFLIDRRQIHRPPPDGHYILLRSLNQLLNFL